jgi:hypothetical protein
MKAWIPRIYEIGHCASEVLGSFVQYLSGQGSFVSSVVDELFKPPRDVSSSQL